jgi:hypothetical protein
MPVRRDRAEANYRATLHSLFRFKLLEHPVDNGESGVRLL